MKKFRYFLDFQNLIFCHLFHALDHCEDKTVSDGGKRDCLVGQVKNTTKQSQRLL